MGIKMIIKYETKACPSCRKLKACMEQLGLKADKEVIIDSNNIDEARLNYVQGFPTLLKIDENNTEIDRIVGLPAINRLKQFFE